MEVVVVEEETEVLLKMDIILEEQVEVKAQPKVPLVELVALLA